MASKNVLYMRDQLVNTLMNIDKKRDDLYMQHVWGMFSRFISVYEMDKNIRRLAREMPEELKQHLAA